MIYYVSRAIKPDSLTHSSHSFFKTLQMIYTVQVMYDFGTLQKHLVSKHICQLHFTQLCKMNWFLKHNSLDFKIIAKNHLPVSKIPNTTASN